MDFENEIRERLTAAEQSVKSAHHRLDTQDKLIESVRDLASQIGSLASDVGSLKEDVNSLAIKVDDADKLPGKRYDLIVRTVITGVISAVVGYFVACLFN